MKTLRRMWVCECGSKLNGLIENINHECPGKRLEVSFLGRTYYYYQKREEEYFAFLGMKRVKEPHV